MKTKEQYAEFLKSEFWRRLSFTVRKKSGFRCGRCGKLDHCQAHHKFYREDWYQTQEADLECVCRDCHEVEHGLKPKPLPVPVAVPRPAVTIPAGAEMWTRQMVLDARSRKQISKEVFKALIRHAKNGPKLKKRRRPQREKNRYPITYWSPRARPKYVNRGKSSN